MNTNIVQTQILYLSFLFLTFSCKAQQTKLVGGSCQGCEAIYEYGNKKLSSIDTLPGFHTLKPRLKVSGTVFKKDGETPAQNVILYVYQTNRQGIYKANENAKGWGKIHGDVRGWIRTDINGKYTFYTFRPAAYPNRTEPEHIHLTVKEPGINEYYLDNYYFLDDPLLTQEQRIKLSNRGGSGILNLKYVNGILCANRNIILGKNIPNYN